MGDMDQQIENEAGKGYALSGKIMLSAIVILFAVVVFMVGLHLYARWYLVRLRRRQLERRRGRHHVGRGAQILMYVDTRNTTPADRGLELPVLNSLPVFMFSGGRKAEEQPQECAVCISEYEGHEVVRLLPKCNHIFHIDCIDMWFRSHSTCPICRSPVEFEPERIYQVGRPMTEPVGFVNGPPAVGSSSGSGVSNTCRHDEVGGGDAGTALSGSRRKGLDLPAVTIEVPPRRNESDSELTQNSPASRFLSLKRILSMGRKSPSGVGTSGGATELDLEGGLSESNIGGSNGVLSR
ncbi:hypothetical protein ABFS82_07G011700 [Erythranthe guttata]|uniref:RING-type E3 ubiquitin transferase n=1 Tax=Erythranthe guttata TaxID=4155 RepID=A0A022RVH8_ERYGU|nr:PREDICTED: RING-H2 finger protein ATL2-like [Erythranthe guttata]EYU43976.1 hypothetical protein MIMGU_mgv1a011050mg [Erythranthe guttata]|eukprot:XP_012828501.1 PREDICTED: RING-H2 finger protein ATL2-like [Erythranthe guttata]